MPTDLPDDTPGRIRKITTGQMKQTYVYDNASGNLLSRDYRLSGSATGLTESFSYDNLNRLTGSQVTGAGLMSVTYSPDGNINTKTDAGSYAYDPSKQNAVTAITRYYSGSYEKTITGSTVTETHYVSSPTGLVAILVKQGSAVQTYYVETDHLGSVTGIINTDKTYASRSSYDAWGRRRNPADWSYNNIPTPVITDRGFTGHEHLDRFGLINMNGRMYDPVVGRFLGVDPVVQAPDYSQSFNGYSYCWNNPLKYTDPSGYLLDADSWQRSMYESSLRRRGISQSDIWMMEYDPYWGSYFEAPYNTSSAAGSSYYSNYSTIYGKQPENPHRFKSGYWVREWVDSNGNIIYPDGLSGMGYIPEITIVERFVPIYAAKNETEAILYFIYSYGKTQRAGGWGESMENNIAGSFDLISAAASKELAKVSLGASTGGLLMSLISLYKINRDIRNNGSESFGDKSRLGLNIFFAGCDFVVPFSGFVPAAIDSWGKFEASYHQMDVLQATGYWVYYNWYKKDWKAIRLR